MNRITSVLLLTLLCFFAADAQKKASPNRQNDSWVSYISKKYGFKAIFPEKPAVIDMDVSTPPVKRTNYMFSSMTSWGFFGVLYSDNPVLPVREKEDLSADYEFLKSNLQNLKNAEIIGEKEINLGKISGRELMIKSKDLVTIDRLFLVNKKLYQMVVTIDYVDLENEPINKQVKRFFDSFALLEGK